jgi:hypothetical protein
MESLPTPCYTKKIWLHFMQPPLPAPNLPAHQLKEQTGEKYVPHGNSLPTPRNINQHTQWADWFPTPPPTKLNNKQRNVIKHRQQRGQVECWNYTREKGEGKGSKPNTELTVKKHGKGSEDWEWVGNKPLPEAGQVVDHRAHLLRQNVVDHRTDTLS